MGIQTEETVQGSTCWTSGPKQGMVSGIRLMKSDENQGIRSGQEWQHTELTSELLPSGPLNLSQLRTGLTIRARLRLELSPQVKVTW